jgi:hypothetical protein
MVIATVTEAQTRAYEKEAWHLGSGVKPLIDGVTIRFATDWANCVLKQFVAEYSKVIQAQVVNEIRALAQKKQAETATNAVATQPVPAGAPQKGQIVLTD